LRILEGGIALVQCVNGYGAKQCEDGNDPACCGVHLVMLDLKKSITSVLETTTLADIIRKKETAQINKLNIIYYTI
jgi:DNA-binding IscR family transcriptional regulator